MSSIAIYRAGRAPSRHRLGPYLLDHSNLPGPRGNLELAAAVADGATRRSSAAGPALGPDVAPENTPGCFLAFCGVVGLGVVLARGAGRGEAPVAWPPIPRCGARLGGETPPLRILRTLAADPRWRIREAVAMALQRWGDGTWPACWPRWRIGRAGNPLEQRGPPRRCASRGC